MYLKSLGFRVERNAPNQTKARSHQLMLQAGLIRPVSAGVFGFSALLWSVVQRIEAFVRCELEAVGFQEVMMPTIQPLNLWRESGRWDHYEKERTMLTLHDRKGQEFCLGSTYEEVVIDLCRRFLNSYRQLPFRLYQISEKFRDDLRPRYGLVRGRQFRMKDGYSFDATEGGMHEAYQETRNAYCRIFEACKLSFVVFSDMRGSIGSRFAEKYMAATTEGEEAYLRCDCGYLGKYVGSSACPQCSKIGSATTALELGHIFELGVYYPQKMGAMVADNTGAQQPIWMGDFGIGISRIPVALVEQYMDSYGIRWPFKLAPAHVAIVPVRPNDPEQMNAASNLAHALETHLGFQTCVDDRPHSFGSRLKDIDFLGIPLQVIVGDHIREGSVDVQKRLGSNRSSVAIDDAVNVLNTLAQGETK